MRSLALQQHQPGFILTILNGADKGATYQVGFGRITLGREANNTIVIKDDPRVSRHHALIVVGPTGCEISDISDKNKVLVNGEQIIDRHKLVPGMTIQLGNTKIQFTTGNAGREIQPHQGAAAPHLSPFPQGMAATSRKSRRKKTSAPFYVILGVLVLMLYLLFSGETKEGDGTKSLVETQIEASIEESQKALAELKAQEKKSGLSKEQLSQAQASYIKGFRDYQKGQFERARESFEACLALFPNHPQCKTYKILAEQRFEELIESYLNLGRKYQEQNQFGACMAALRNVLVLMKNRASPIFKEAQANYELCKELDRGSF